MQLYFFLVAKLLSLLSFLYRYQFLVCLFIIHGVSGWLPQALLALRFIRSVPEPYDLVLLRKCCLHLAANCHK